MSCKLLLICLLIFLFAFTSYRKMSAMFPYVILNNFFENHKMPSICLSLFVTTSRSSGSSLSLFHLYSSRLNDLYLYHYLLIDKELTLFFLLYTFIVELIVMFQVFLFSFFFCFSFFFSSSFRLSPSFLSLFFCLRLFPSSLFFCFLLEFL